MRLKNLLGQRFTAWTVIARAEGATTRWLCQCDCGNTRIVPAYHLVHGRSTSCGCLKGKPMRGVKHDLTGQRFGRWTVMEEAVGKNGHTYWRCQCDCGTVRDVAAAPLKNGTSPSCGCLGVERLTKHGLHQHPDYVIWGKMRERCLNPHALAYKNYGGRGITICPQWDDFATFLADMGPRPSRRHSIDRIDVNGDYTPENCRWATTGQQANNTRTSRLIPWRGETRTITEWAQLVGMNVDVLRTRLHYHWPLDKVFTQPVEQYRPRQA